MQLTAWATLAALAVYFWTVANAGRARMKYKVAAPSMDGPPPFLNCQRVHVNTLEQMPLLLPPLWMCAVFFSDRWAAACGLLWCVGRIMYGVGYYKDPAMRGPGYMVGMVACLLLFGGTVVGLLMH